jgi:hypothetical protein
MHLCFREDTKKQPHENSEIRGIQDPERQSLEPPQRWKPWSNGVYVIRHDFSEGLMFEETKSS